MIIEVSFVVHKLGEFATWYLCSTGYASCPTARTKRTFGISTPIWAWRFPLVLCLQLYVRRDCYFPAIYKHPTPGRQPRSHESLDEQHGSEEARFVSAIVGILLVPGMRQVGYDEAVESEAATDDEICEPEKPREPQGNPSPRTFAIIIESGFCLHEH